MADPIVSERTGRIGAGVFGVVLIGAIGLCGFLGWLWVEGPERSYFGLGLMMLLGAILARAAWAALTYAATGREAGPAVHPAVRVGVGVLVIATVVVTVIGGLARGEVVGSLLTLGFGALYLIGGRRRDSRGSGVPTEPMP